MGLRLALDDFTHFDQYIPALALVDIVKLDLPLFADDDLADMVQQRAVGRFNCWLKRLTTAPSFRTAPGWGLIYSKAISSPNQLS